LLAFDLGYADILESISGAKRRPLFGQFANNQLQSRRLSFAKLRKAGSHFEEWS
jgi:hypothetical protein